MGQNYEIPLTYRNKTLEKLLLLPVALFLSRIGELELMQVGVRRRFSDSKIRDKKRELAVPLQVGGRRQFSLILRFVIKNLEHRIGQQR